MQGNQSSSLVTKYKNVWIPKNPRRSSLTNHCLCVKETNGTTPRAILHETFAAHCAAILFVTSTVRIWGAIHCVVHAMRLPCQSLKGEFAVCKRTK